MGEIVIKHFKRSGIGSDDKELITEIVIESSDTGRFLQRMEASRLTRPCFQTIDMRGRVDAECYRYAFNDRVHYLDDVSFQLFEQGLRKHNGVYTVGTFEAIMGRARALRAQQESDAGARRRAGQVAQRQSQHVDAAASADAVLDDRQPGRGKSDPAAQPLDSPHMLRFGYFRRRGHPRLRYTCAVVLEHGKTRTKGTTLDISVGGARVHVKGVASYQWDQEVLLSYPELSHEAGEVDVSRIAYRVVSSEACDGDTVLCLNRPDTGSPAGFSQFLEAFVERYQRRYKLDANDEYQSVLSWYYERCYAQSATQIPIFVEQSQSKDLHIQAVAMSEGNSHLARFFCTDVDSYNFTPLCLPHRLQRLAQERSFVMAMYRRRSEQDQCMRIHSVADFECPSRKAFYDLIAYAVSQSDHCIVKVHVGQVPAVTVSEQKVDVVSQRLQHKSDSKMAELRERLAKLHLVGYVVDLTQDFKLGADRSGHEAMGKEGELAVWVGSELRDLGSGAVRERLSLAVENLQPELIRFGYVERRREDRYLAETKVEVRTGVEVYEGLSKDISTRGMRIQLKQHVDIRKGISIKVGLVSLQQKRSSANLMEIPYRVVETTDDDTGTTLMLERIVGGKHGGLDAFFVELISKNRHKLAVDIADIWSATAARVYEALLAANTPTVPFFLARNDEGGAHLQFVGIAESKTPLLDYFSGDKGVDFRCLNEQRFVTALYDAVQIMLRQSRNSDGNSTPFELDMYLYKEVDSATGEIAIHAATGLDFATDAERKAFCRELMSCSDWRCIKIISTFTQPLDEKVLDEMVDSLRAQSKHRAIKLSDLAHSMVGYGELIDITEEWSWLRSADVAS